MMRPILETESPYIDLAITSPPYINALDYTRCVKIEGAMCDCIDNEIADRHAKCTGGP